MPQTSVSASQDQKIARLYQNVPAEQLERLRRFRAAYPYQRTTINGHDWSYIDAGQGRIVVLILPGALGTAESAFLTISYFAEKADRYRVLAPSYPASIATMGDLVDGIARIMDQSHIAAACVIGGSYGGFVAQAFVHRHPHKTQKLILSHTSPPDPERGRQIARVLRWASVLPLGLLRSSLKKSLTRLLPKGNTEVALIAAQMTETIDYQMTREALFNGYRRVVDFDKHDALNPAELADWPGEVLLVMGEDDPATPEATRRAMKALYPRAQEHVFRGTGHATSILKREEYCALIETFVG